MSKVAWALFSRKNKKLECPGTYPDSSADISKRIEIDSKQSEFIWLALCKTIDFEFSGQNEWATLLQDLQC